MNIRWNRLLNTILLVLLSTSIAAGQSASGQPGEAPSNYLAILTLVATALIALTGGYAAILNLNNSRAALFQSLRSSFQTLTRNSPENAGVSQ
jgi:hypothetical protein